MNPFDPYLYIIAAISAPFVLAALYFMQPDGEEAKRVARMQRAVEWDRMHGRGRENV